MKKRISKKQYVREVQDALKEYNRANERPVTRQGKIWRVRWRRLVWMKHRRKNHGVILAVFSYFLYMDEREEYL